MVRLLSLLQPRDAPVNDAADATFHFADTFTHTAHIEAAFPGAHIDPRALCDHEVTFTMHDGALVVEYASQALENRIPFAAQQLGDPAQARAGRPVRRDRRADEKDDGHREVRAGALSAGQAGPARDTL